MGGAGVRKRNALGGELELAQRYGWQQTNSLFFAPNPQGTARLELNYTQPLLNGAGQAVNLSRVVLAELDSQLSLDDSAEQLQSHLLDVTETYWDLYRARANYLMRLKLLHGALAVRQTLETHADNPAERQLLRARAAVTARQAQILRAQASIKNEESRLRQLVNDPLLAPGAPIELLPGEAPVCAPMPYSLADAMHTALVNRPDISQSIRQIRSASVRLGVADNDLKPKLNMILGTYVAGLEADSNVGSAFANQFTEGRPSYAAGLVFEFPWGNRAAKARHDQRIWEFNRALHEFRAVVGQGMTDVELASREVDTSCAEVASAYEAMFAAEREAANLDLAWRQAAGDDAAAEVLESLLWAQQRLADQELAYVEGQVRYAKALARLKRSMGTLLTLARSGSAHITSDPITGSLRNTASTQQNLSAGKDHARGAQTINAPLPFEAIPRQAATPKPAKVAGSNRAHRPLQHHVLNPRAAAGAAAGAGRQPAALAVRPAMPIPRATVLQQGQEEARRRAAESVRPAYPAAQTTGWTVPAR
jgi:outer membrane protein TolC